MGWFLYCIARNPDEQVNLLYRTSVKLKFYFQPLLLQKLLLDEVDDIFEDSDRHCTPQDAANLKYLECCIKESLRLYPSVPGILRTLTEDTQVGKPVQIFIERNNTLKKKEKIFLSGCRNLQSFLDRVFAVLNCYDYNIIHT